MGTETRGFASMDPKRLREVASHGGKKTSGKHDMAKIGQKGGQKTALKGSDYFKRIGSLGGKAPRSKRPKETK